MSEVYSIDPNIVKTKALLTEIAIEQATREFSGTAWLEDICKKIDEIDEKKYVK